MGTYIKLEDIGKAILVTGAVRVVSGHSDINHSDEKVELSDALKSVNQFNIGYYHPDVYVSTPNHLQVVIGDVIMGFIPRED